MLLNLVCHAPHGASHAGRGVIKFTYNSSKLTHFAVAAAAPVVGLAEIRSRFGDKYQFLYIVTEERQYIETGTYRLNQLYETGTYRLKSAVRDQLYERLLKLLLNPCPKGRSGWVDSERTRSKPARMLHRASQGDLLSHPLQYAPGLRAAWIFGGALPPPCSGTV